jgi:hypothetical protein
MKRWAKLMNIRTNEPIDESAFRWAVPPAAHPVELPGGIILPTGKDLRR